ncbi:MAG TPA: nucleotide exchange factor GrpE [Candidatus Limiplasma sp.]|nr:nucleotide exchange factor GrpE [Candidatus Limiplasma sp.]
MPKHKTVKPEETAPEPKQNAVEAQAEELPETAVEIEETAAEDVKADVEALETALAEANGKAEEYLNMAQRVQADFDNYRRRNQNVRGEAFEDGAKSVVSLLLPVLDNMERAMEAAESSEDKALREGVQMVSRQLWDVFDKRGVKPISRAGEKFDPSLENAVMTGTPEDGEAGTVCEVLQKGYSMGSSVLRHAMVKVVPE